MHWSHLESSLSACEDGIEACRPWWDCGYQWAVTHPGVIHPSLQWENRPGAQQEKIYSESRDLRKQELWREKQNLRIMFLAGVSKEKILAGMEGSGLALWETHAQLCSLLVCHT